MLDILTQSEILSNYPFHEGRADWPVGAIYRYDRGGHEMLRIVQGVDDGMTASVTHEPVEFALVIDGPLVVMCCRAGETLPWDGATFHWHRVRRTDRVLPTSAIDTLLGSKIALILIEAAGGRVRAARSLALPVEFTRILHEAILEQARFSYDPGEERRAIAALLRRCPTPNSLVAYASARAVLHG